MMFLKVLERWLSFYHNQYIYNLFFWSTTLKCLYLITNNPHLYEVAYTTQQNIPFICESIVLCKHKIFYNRPEQALFPLLDEVLHCTLL